MELVSSRVPGSNKLRFDGVGGVRPLALGAGIDDVLEAPAVSE
jgi:hypothetical protein